MSSNREPYGRLGSRSFALFHPTRMFKLEHPTWSKGILLKALGGSDDGPAPLNAVLSVISSGSVALCLPLSMVVFRRLVGRPAVDDEASAVDDIGSVLGSDGPVVADGKRLTVEGGGSTAGSDGTEVGSDGPETDSEDPAIEDEGSPY